MVSNRHGRPRRHGDQAPHGAPAAVGCRRGPVRQPGHLHGAGPGPHGGGLREAYARNSYGL